MRSKSAALLCVAGLALAAWFGQAQPPADSGWREVARGVFRSPGLPASYALVEGNAALVIDAAADAAGLEKLGVRKVEMVLLTSYHRPVCAAVGEFLERGVPVRAAVGAASWLSKEGVEKYWRESLPLRNSRTAYQVVPAGFDQVRCDLKPGMILRWKSWELEVVDAPGHARAQLAFLARRKKSKERVLFCGGALAAPGKLWAPYTTDWDHWTDLGLKPTAETLVRLAEKKPDVLCPSYGPVIQEQAVEALENTRKAAAEAGLLKSFERFTKERLGNPPQYDFLAKEQATSNGSKPWTQVSPHLYLTGNTYVLVSKDGPCLMVDPWDRRSFDQFLKLQKEKKLGPLEAAWFSHAHYDHYDGIYHFQDPRPQVWALDLVARPIAEPNWLRQPFLDPRPVKFDRTPREGEVLTWREYRFRFHHLPGQTYFTMAVDTEIDGKRCLFTADDFFHQDMFSGTGGWMGLNRGLPPVYAASARKVLELRPEWVLAEHGGPFVFHEEDFRRRAAWGDAAAAACDGLSLTANHRRDWNPHHVHVRPVLHQARPGQELKAELVVEADGGRPRVYDVRLQGRGVVPDASWKLQVPGRTELATPLTLKLSEKLAPGRHVLPLTVREGDLLDASDAFVVVEVGKE